MHLITFGKQLLQKNTVNLFRKQLIRNRSNLELPKKKIGVIGAPFVKGDSKDGAQHGPSLLRATGFINDLEQLGYSVQDHGDIKVDEEFNDPPVGKIINTKSVGKICRKVFEGVKKIVREGEVCITLGGDHSISLGSVLGHAQVNPNLCLIWLDAHSDINTTLTTMSGHLNGIIVSYFFHELHAYNEKLPEFEWVKPSLSVKDMVYIGLRDVDPLERVILQKFGFLTFSMREVDEIGLQEVLRRSLAAVNPDLERPIHMSFDIDALDPIVAPSTSLPVLGGFTLREGLHIAEEIYKTGKLAALDIVETNPVKTTEDDLEKTLYAVRRIIEAFFGGYRGGNCPLGVADIPRRKS